MPDSKTSRLQSILETGDSALQNSDVLYDAMRQQSTRTLVLRALSSNVHTMEKVILKLVITFLGNKNYNYLEHFLSDANLRSFISVNHIPYKPSIHTVSEGESRFHGQYAVEMTLYWIALRDLDKRLMGVVYKYALIPKNIYAHRFRPDGLDMGLDHYEAAHVFSSDGDIRMFRFIAKYAHIPFSLSTLTSSLRLGPKTLKKLGSLQNGIDCWSNAVPRDTSFNHCDPAYINMIPLPETGSGHHSPLGRAIRSRAPLGYIKALLENGANPSLKDKDHLPIALGAALYDGTPEALTLVRNYGAYFVGPSSNHLACIIALLSFCEKNNVPHKLTPEKFKLLLTYVEEDLPSGTALAPLLEGSYAFDDVTESLQDFVNEHFIGLVPVIDSFLNKNQESNEDIITTFFDFGSYIFCLTVVIYFMLLIWIEWNKYSEVKSAIRKLHDNFQRIGVQAQGEYKFTFWDEPSFDFICSFANTARADGMISRHYLFEFFDSIGRNLPRQTDLFIFRDTTLSLAKSINDQLPMITGLINNEKKNLTLLREKLSTLLPADMINIENIALSVDRLHETSIDLSHCKTNFTHATASYTITAYNMLNEIKSHFAEVGLLVTETKNHISIDLSQLYQMVNRDLREHKRQLRSRLVKVAQYHQRPKPQLRLRQLHAVFTDDEGIEKQLRELEENYNGPFGAKGAAERLVRLHGEGCLKKLWPIPSLDQLRDDLIRLKAERQKLCDIAESSEPSRALNRRIELWNTDNAMMKNRLYDIIKWTKMVNGKKSDIEDAVKGVIPRPTSRTSTSPKSTPKNIACEKHNDRNPESITGTGNDDHVNGDSESVASQGAAADLMPASGIEVLFCPAPTEEDLQEFINLTEWRNAVENLDISENSIETRLALGYLVLYHLRILENIRFRNQATQKSIKSGSNAVRHSIYNMITCPDVSDEMVYKQQRTICEYFIKLLSRYDNNRVRVAYVLELNLQQFSLIHAASHEEFSDYHSLKDLPDAQVPFAETMKARLAQEIESITALFKNEHTTQIILALKMSLLHCGDLLKLMLIKYLQLTTERKDTELKAYEGDNEAFQGAKRMICSDFGIPDKTSTFFYEVVVPVANSLAHPKKDDLNCAQLSSEQKRAIECLTTLNLGKLARERRAHLSELSAVLLMPSLTLESDGIQKSTIGTAP